MATLKGRRLQKRRNHLNAYLRAYADKSRITPIKEVDPKLTSAFLAKWGKENGERRFRAETLLAWTIAPHLASGAVSGAGLFYGDELIGVTFSVSHGPYAEILLEHADKSKRGAYQYLLTENLKLNHPNALTVDRQDDMWNADLAQAKRIGPCILLQKT